MIRKRICGNNLKQPLEKISLTLQNKTESSRIGCLSCSSQYGHLYIDMSVRNAYRILRSVVFSLLLTAAGLFLLLYVALWLPGVRNLIREEAEHQLSALTGSRISIGDVAIFPFNQVELQNVKVPSPDGARCIEAEKIGAGISIWRLIRNGEIVITYAEIIGLDAHITKAAPDKPLNIQFLIDAFKPKEKNKPPTKFDLRLHSIVLRRCKISFDKQWMPHRADKSLIDFNHLSFNNIRADINIPRLKNDYFDIDVRSLSFAERSGLQLDNLICHALVTNTSARLSDIQIEMPGTLLRPSDLSLGYNGFGDIMEAFLRERHELKLQSDKVTLSDFKAFAAPLGAFDDPMDLSLIVNGNKEAIDIHRLLISTPDGRLSIDLKAQATGIGDRSMFAVNAPSLKLSVTAGEMEKIVSGLTRLPRSLADKLLRLGEISLEGNLRSSLRALESKSSLKCGLGEIETNAKVAFRDGGTVALDAQASTSGFNIGALLPESGLGSAAFMADASLSIAGKDFSGKLDTDIDFIEYGTDRLSGVSLKASKEGSRVVAEVHSDDPNLLLSANGVAVMSGVHRLHDTPLQFTANVDLKRFVPEAFGIAPKLGGYDFSVYADINLSGQNLDAMLGSVSVRDFCMHRHDGKTLTLQYLDVISEQEVTGEQSLSIKSDWLDGRLAGQYHLTRLPQAFTSLLIRVIPSLSTLLPSGPETDDNFDFNFTLAADNTLPEFFNLPVRLLVPVPVHGALSDSTGTASLNIDVPYLQQGKDKLIRDIHLSASLDASTGISRLDFSTLMPGKKGDTGVRLNVNGIRDDLLTDIGWTMHRSGRYDGSISLSTSLQPAYRGMSPDLEVKINPSVIHVADTAWNIGGATIGWHDRKLDIKGLSVSSGPQFVHIDGVASELPTDTIKVQFADFSLDYLFETLNINYVTFGGRATGSALATQIFSPNPVAVTDGLTVADLTYNRALLGDSARLRGSWDNRELCVGIGADIYDKGRLCANVEGGVWVGCDSLRFDFDTDKVNVAFLLPFMQAFSSGIEGRASGKARLAGNFHDIDMTGRLFADTVRMKVDYTNVWYAGSDSVILTPGQIEIPRFRLYDRYGHSGYVSGTLTHRYFHEPRFNFRLEEGRQLLAYDTDASSGNDWYGKVFVNGSADIRGVPGMVNVMVDASTAKGTEFCYVLSDTEAAEEYTFLTFSDKRKEELQRLELLRDTTPEFVKRFRRQVADEAGRPSDFGIDLRVSVTPEAALTIVMDPRAGDKITATGQGAMQIAYDSESDRLRMYGKYSIDQGKYLFTLQDLIIRDFKIAPGSYIAFNGDPLAATLDIDASYRVNTNLTDLDKSFASDRELNRTNVPVDAVLSVGGDLQNPEIAYDIKLPTLTADVERKVKSIISTEDLMSRQILYLLALNRFYTPEYMSASGGNGSGELASVASSTISSQITNILGQISDKWSIAPSFRTDKGDFSDTEVDLALSSRLLNNRLLLNGNFGYRDRSTSQTTFVGDFDLEYLLNRNGDLRLKAYNHFNDQNYYLRSALTTQGIGIVYKRDFDNPFTFLRRKKKAKPETADSLSVQQGEKTVKND